MIRIINLESRLNIFQITNLKLPEPSVPRASYTNEQLTSSILMMVMGNFAKRFIHSFPNIPKAVLIDESWALGRTKEGQSLIEYITRNSRSLYSTIILNGHSVLDIPDEGIKNTVTYKFCFHTNSRDEAVRMLEYLNVEVTPTNLDLVMNLENRQCLFQDLNKRVGVLTFDAVFDDIISVFSTTPKAETVEELVESELLEVLEPPINKNYSHDLYAYEQPVNWSDFLEGD